MTGFEVRWLDLREAADHAARDAELRLSAIDYVQASDNPMIVDLGCGTASTFRALLPESVNWNWRLLDNDPRLLAEAMARHGSSGGIECVQTDLHNLSAAVFDGACLVTASALFDLVSEAFLARLVAILSANHIGLYTGLNYDGHLEWEMPLVMDTEVVSAFNTHQRRDKGFGAALGPSAGQVLQTWLSDKDFEVSIGSSPWQLTANETELQRQLIDGIARAAAETGMLEATSVEEWRLKRIDLIGRSRCKVGHWDMLALPK